MLPIGLSTQSSDPSSASWAYAPVRLPLPPWPSARVLSSPGAGRGQRRGREYQDLGRSECAGSQRARLYRVQMKEKMPSRARAKGDSPVACGLDDASRNSLPPSTSVFTSAVWSPWAVLSRRGPPTPASGVLTSAQGTLCPCGPHPVRSHPVSALFLQRVHGCWWVGGDIGWPQAAFRAPGPALCGVHHSLPPSQ